MSFITTRLLFVAMSMLPLLSSAAEGPKLERGRAVYQDVCMACHAQANVMVSAPKAGDAAEWARRAAQSPAGLEMLTTHAIEGFGAMPPKGGRSELTRAQIRDAIEFMRWPSADPGPTRGQVTR
jgi:cytochrome c5